MVAEAANGLLALARDPAQRAILVAGQAIPAAGTALRCMIPPLAAAWKHVDSSGHVIAACGAVGRAKQPEGSPLPELGDCKDWSELKLVEGCTSVCGMLRNLCAKCPEGQARVRREGGLQLLIVIVHVCCTYYERPSDQLDPSQTDKLLTTALQALGNAEVGNDRNRDEVWEGLWPEVMSRVFTSDASSGCKEVAGMVLYNALLGAPARIKDFAEREACGAILGGLLRETYAMSSGPVSEDAKLMREKVGAWTECVAGLLLRDGHIMRVHQRLSTDPGLRRDGQEPMELLFWYVVEDLVTPRTSERDEERAVKLAPTDCAYVANEFALVLKMCSDAAGRGDSGSGSLALTLTQILHTIAAAMSREDGEAKAAMRERGLLRNIVELLKAAIAREQGTKAGSSVQGASPAMGEVAGPDSGLKRVLVRVIGNMAFKDRGTQDEIRRLGAIPLVLASTQLDENQPFAREWGLFAIRNLCEDNLENQKEIGDLKPSKVVALPPELQQQGVSVTLDEHTGKLRYDKDSDLGGRVGPAHVSQVDREAERRRGVENTQRMVAELREMGLEANIDEDTGLVDIARAGVPPPKFSYPGEGGQAEGGSGA